MGADHDSRGARKVLEDEKYLRCTRCALCIYTCPIYRELLIETDAPRGKVALIRSVAEGQLDPGEHYAQKVYRCLQCGACTANCPSGVEVDRLMEAARAELVEGGLLPPPIARLGETITTYGNVSGDDNSQRLVWTENLEQLPEGAAPAGETEIVYSKTEEDRPTLWERINPLNIFRRKRKRKRELRVLPEVLYFVGCVSSFFPAGYGVAQAFIEILEAAGVGYALLGGKEWCCGYPLLISGQNGDAEVLIAHNIARVRALGATRVVASCASCYYAWKHMYPKIGGGFGIEVLHSTEFLAELIKSGRLRLREFPEIVTYHDPCDLGRKSGIYDAPRQVLESIPGLSLVEMVDNRQSSRCCGGGGNLETLDRPLSQAIAERRVEQALATGAAYLVTACPQCKRTLMSAVRRKKVRLRVIDITELVAKLVEKEDSR